MLFILEVLNLKRFPEYACWIKFYMGKKKVFLIFVFLILAKIASLYCLWKLLIIVFNYRWLSLISFAYL